MSRAGENLGICRKKVKAGVLWLKFSPGATESPHSFQGWGLFSHLARLPASPVLWNGSLQGNSTRTSGWRSPCIHFTTVCARSDCMNSFHVERDARACLDSPSFHKQFDTSVRGAEGFYAASSKKSSQDSWLVTKKFWESMLKKVNTFCQ